MTVADQPNYTVAGVTGALTINAAPVIPQITGSLTGSVSKVYDSTNIATLTPANYVLTGWVGADSATVTKTSGTYDNATSGTNKTVTVSLSGGDFVAGAGTNLANYELPTFVSGAVGTIGKANLTATANSMAVVYNGVNQSLSGFTVTGLRGADTIGGLVGISASGATGTKAGTYANTMTVANQTNYTVTGVNGALTIGAAQLTGTLTGSVSKVYDVSTVATLTPANYVLTGWFGADSALVTKTIGTYDNANAGTNKTVSVSLSGGEFVAGAGTNLANYLLPTSISGTVGTIGKANLTATANSMAVVYNGDNQSLSGFTVTGLRGADTVAGLLGISASGATGTNAGTYVNTMKVANQTNYTVTGVNGALTIGAAQLTGTLTGSVSKVYDGTTVATLTPANYTLTGWLGSDGAVVSKTLGSYNNANVGVGKTVTVSLSRSDYQASGGADLSNYNLPTSLTGLEGVITPKNVSLSSFVVANKVYDGNNVATITSGSVLTGVGSETLSVRGTGSFVDKNAGNAKLVKPADVSALTQLDGSGSWLNYKLVNSNVTSTASITPKLIQASGSVGDKVYDGTVAATVNGMAAVGLLTGDTVYLQAGSADFAEKDVSRDASGNIASKVVTVSRLSLAGVDAQNYLLDRNMFTAQARITPRPLQLSAQALNKVYDSTPLATIKLGGLIGLVGAEQLQVMAAGAFENAEIGTNKLVNVRFDLGNGPNGGFAENYSLIPQTLRASITNQTAIPPLEPSAVPSAVKPATSAVTFAVKTPTSAETFSGAALAAVGERVSVQPSVVSCDLNNLEDCDCEPSKLDNVLICYVPREATATGRMLPNNTGAFKK
jgi:acetolactate synthase regulatory subunit